MVRATEIAQFLQSQLLGLDCDVTSVASLGNPKTGSLMFARSWSDETAQQISASGTAVILLPRGHAKPSPHLALIEVDNPRLAYARAANYFFTQRSEPHVARTAVIGQDTRLGSRVIVGEYTVIGANVEIGDDTEIRHHVVIADGTRIGSRCLIRSHSVIGEEGFGMEYDENGHAVRMPHLGHTIIGDDVEIGALNTVCRGTIEPTIVSNGVKTDDHVHIAHNCQIGPDSLLTASATLGGSVKVGRQSWLGVNATVMNGVNLGDRAFIGLGANVVKSVSDETVVFGNPAKPIRKREGL